MSADQQPPVQPTMSPVPRASDADRPRRGILPTTMESWLMLGAGAALMIYGGYSVISALVAGRSISLVGLVLLGVGGMLMPYRWIGLIAGVGLIGMGIYMFIANYVTLQALVVTVLGVIAVAEQVRRGK